MEPAVEFPSWADAALPVQRATTRIFVFNHFGKIESINGSN